MLMVRMSFLFLIGSSLGYSQVILKKSDQRIAPFPHGQWTLDWSADNKLIASGGDDSLVRIYNASTFAVLKVYRLNGMIRQVRWHPSNHFLLITCITPVLEILNVDRDEVVLLKHNQYGARAIDWSYDGMRFAVADGIGTVRIWGLDGKEGNAFEGNDRRSYFSLDWHPHQNTLITGGDDIRIFDTERGLLKIIQHRIESTGVLVVRWHPSGKYFVSGDYGHHEEGIASFIQFWTADGELLKTIRASKKEYRTLAWSHDGQYLATAGDRLRIWSESGDLIFEDETGSSQNIWGMAWQSDNKKLACIDFEGNLKIWEAGNWRILSQPK